MKTPLNLQFSPSKNNREIIPRAREAGGGAIGDQAASATVFAGVGGALVEVDLAKRTPANAE